MVICNNLRKINSDNQNNGSLRAIKNNEISNDISYEKTIELKENSILDYKTLCNLRQVRLGNVLNEKYHYSTSIKKVKGFYSFRD